MRALATMILLTAGTAFADRPRLRDEERTLTAAEVGRYAEAYYPAIKACYFTKGRPPKGATGELAVKLVVHRNGYIRDITVDAPGVRGKAMRKLEGCIRNETLGWSFPVRRDFTTAILPYYFLYLDAPGAGPQYSCWNPQGCRSNVAKRTPNT